MKKETVSYTELATIIVVFFILGVAIGYFSFYKHTESDINIFKAKVEAKKERCIDAWIDCKTLNRQYEFAVELLENEFNLSGKLLEMNKTEMYQKYFDKLKELADDIEDIRKERW